MIDYPLVTPRPHPRLPTPGAVGHYAAADPAGAHVIPTGEDPPSDDADLKQWLLGYAELGSEAARFLETTAMLHRPNDLGLTPVCFLGPGVAVVLFKN